MLSGNSAPEGRAKICHSWKSFRKRRDDVFRKSKMAGGQSPENPIWRSRQLGREEMSKHRTRGRSTGSRSNDRNGLFGNENSPAMNSTSQQARSAWEEKAQPTLCLHFVLLLAGCDWPEPLNMALSFICEMGAHGSLSPRIEWANKVSVKPHHVDWTLRGTISVWPGNADSRTDHFEQRPLLGPSPHPTMEMASLSKQAMTWKSKIWIREPITPLSSWGYCQAPAPSEVILALPVHILAGRARVSPAASKLRSPLSPRAQAAPFPWAPSSEVRRVNTCRQRSFQAASYNFLKTGTLTSFLGSLTEHRKRGPQKYGPCVFGPWTKYGPWLPGLRCRVLTLAFSSFLQIPINQLASVASQRSVPMFVFCKLFNKYILHFTSV